MKAHFAGIGIPKKDMLEFRKEHIDENYCFLYSYLEVKSGNYDLLQKHISPEQVILDSGAFSAFTIGAVIDIDDYIRVIKESGVKYYITLDEIGNPQKTKENTEYMESKGLNPIPVFHYNSPKEDLLEMIEKYDYICLGGLVPLSMKKKKLKIWLDHCFSIIKDKVRVHGLGINSLEIWKRYPFYSVDATSWVAGSKFRRIIEFKNGRFITHSKTKDRNKKTFQVYTSDYKKLNISNMLEYKKAEKYVTDLWSKRGIKWK